MRGTAHETTDRKVYEIVEKMLAILNDRDVLRKDAFEDAQFPEISKAVKYFKETEGGRSEMCKTVEDFAEDYAKTVRIEAIRNMIELGLTKDQILKKYSEEEYRKAEEELLTTV